MAPPKSKLRKRRNNNKNNNKNDGGDDDCCDKDNGNEQEAIDMFGLFGEPGAKMSTTKGKNIMSAGESDFDFPKPPGMNGQQEDDDDDDDDDDDMKALPTKSKLRQQQQKRQSNGEAGDTPKKLAKAEKGIKMVPLIILLLMFGTTLIPAFIFVGDSISAYWSKSSSSKSKKSGSSSSMFGSVGYHLGIGQIPRKRVISFYEKHNPEKLPEVSKLLAKHYGEYPKLLKKLERKYQDYGYFMGWQDDETPSRMIQEQFREWYSIWIQKYWNVYMPIWIRTRMRNVKYNLLYLYKQGRKIWRKYIWPNLLEPIFGIPDAKTAAQQKRQDAKRAEQQQRSSSSSKTRRRNTDYRDD